MEAFIRRLKERKLVAWALAYAAAAFAVEQFVQMVAQSFHWPDSVMRWSFAVLLVGFAVTLLVAWFHGERGQQRVSAAELSIFAALLLAAAAGTAVLRVRNVPPGDRSTVAYAGDSLPSRTLAVLPFANLSGSSDNAYFADGIHDELLTQLSRIADLQVISRTSVMQYRNTVKPLRQIGRELGAGSILEASVQRAGGQVRIEAELVDARTDRRLWAETYTRDLRDVFAMESEVARGIAGALEARLTELERAAIANRPTASADAYDFYLRGRERISDALYREEDIIAAERLFERAVALDPHFAPAWGALAEIYGEDSYQSDVFIPNLHGRAGVAAALMEKARTAAERAIRLQPDAPEGHMALGWYRLYAQRDFRQALHEFEAARSALPSSAPAWSGIAVALRLLGRWDESLAASSRVLTLDPRNRQGLNLLADTYRKMGRYTDAMRTERRLSEIAPDLPFGAAPLYDRFQVDADTALLRRSLDSLPASEFGPRGRYWLRMLERDPAAALREVPKLSEFFEGELTFIPRPLLGGFAHRLAGDSVAARASFDSARAVLEAAATANPADPRMFGPLAFAYAGLGRCPDAIHASRRAIELRPEATNPLEGPGLMVDLAGVYAWCGQRDPAFRLLDHLVSIPVAGITPARLRFDDEWDSLRADPRFPGLVARAAAEVARRQ